MFARVPLSGAFRRGVSLSLAARAAGPIPCPASGRHTALPPLRRALCQSAVRLAAAKQPEPARTFYTKSHEWVRIEGDEATIGITEFRTRELGELVAVRLPEVGTKCNAGCYAHCLTESSTWKAPDDLHTVE
eukprot:EG_transcript_46482